MAAALARTLVAPGREIGFVGRGIDTGGRRLTTEWTVSAWDGPLPHRHPAMRESWEVLEGALTITIDGVEHLVEVGAPPVVAEPGVVHAFRQAGTGTLRWRQTNEPVLNHELLFVLDHQRARRGGGPTAKPGPILTIRLLAATDAVFVGPPVVLQRVLGAVGAVLNRRLRRRLAV